MEEGIGVEEKEESNGDQVGIGGYYRKALGEGKSAYSRAKRPRKEDKEEEEDGEEDKVLETNKTKGGRRLMSITEEQGVLQVIQSLKDQTLKMSKNGSQVNDEPVDHMDEALAPHLLVKDYPINWRQPKLPTYNGKSDPKDHLHSFITGMEDVTKKDDIWCMMFRRMLREELIGWYQGLPKGSIISFLDRKTTFRQAYNHHA